MVTTRAKNYGSNRDVHNQGVIAPTPETLHDRRRRWSHLLDLQHYHPVISEVLDEELPKYINSAIIDVTDRISLVRECALVLASAPAVFSAAVNGNLVRQMLSDLELQAKHAVVQERAHDQPSIYIHLLADDHGIAPTPNQYLGIMEMMLDYLKDRHDSEHASQLDNITPPIVTKAASSQGHQTLRRLCQGIQNRWLETPTCQHDTPLQYPPGECGYSKNSHLRLAQHRTHQSSNYVMNLIEDICTYLHRTRQFKQHFRMHQFIIYLIFRPSQAAIAEIFCSGLLQVWVENGGGFNAYPAGRSVATAGRVSIVEWGGHERWAREKSPVIKNMMILKERADEWHKALEWEKSVAEDPEMTEGSADEDADDAMSASDRSAPQSLTPTR
ncbi:Nn.00g030990.m01.CDS01 [Neocucurbitaria sp. VM-36]